VPEEPFARLKGPEDHFCRAGEAVREGGALPGKALPSPFIVLQKAGIIGKAPVMRFSPNAILYS
jgi:hypothetical protein